MKNVSPNTSNSALLPPPPHPRRTAKQLLSPKIETVLPIKIPIKANLAEAKQDLSNEDPDDDYEDSTDYHPQDYDSP